jgi:hypothetical protein
MAKLVQVGFSNEDRSGGVKPLDNMRVEIRNPIEQNLRSAGGAHTGSGKHVFDCDRDAVQRAAMATMNDFIIRRFCCSTRLLVEHGNECIEPWLEAFESFEGSGHDLCR